MKQLVRNSMLKSHRPILTAFQNQRLLSLLTNINSFSTQSENPKPIDSGGFVYGKLLGISKRTTKSDILLLLDGINNIVSADDIRVKHDRSFNTLNMMMQFPSHQAFETVFRALNRRSRFHRLERSDRTQWQNFIPYDGKSILLQGIPKTAQYDDIERFLSGCAYDQSVPLQIITRKTDPEADPTRMVVVQFPSRAQAAYAFLKTNREFCQNEQISVRVLE